MTEQVPYKLLKNMGNLYSWKGVNMSDDFKRGAKSMFDYLLFRAANNYHFNAEKNTEREKFNDQLRDWVTDALECVSPDDHAEWKSLSDSFQEIAKLEFDLAASRWEAQKANRRIKILFDRSNIDFFPDNHNNSPIQHKGLEYGYKTKGDEIIGRIDNIIAKEQLYPEIKNE